MDRTTWIGRQSGPTQTVSAAVISAMPEDVASNENELAPNQTRTTMRIFIFKSDARAGLRAFCDSPAGEGLPRQFAPWHAVGVVTPDRAPPHKLSRDTIEQAIKQDGFQLWRLTTNQAS